MENKKLMDEEIFNLQCYIDNNNNENNEYEENEENSEYEENENISSNFLIKENEEIIQDQNIYKRDENKIYSKGKKNINKKFYC